ncbi:MAG: hypothetical protein ABFD92_01450 [Planctomycetaceae bacterium]|nr:hypothetical protein [Planctomycetaceae bacterium]
MTLQDWQNNGWLTEHQSSPQEIIDLLAVADRDLKDCQSEGLSADWRFNIAYNALLQTATAALAAAGYRATRDAHHFRVLQSLALTVGLDAKVIRKHDAFRKKRNLTGYERVGAVSDQEVVEVIQAAQSVRQATEEWIATNYPHLLL